MFHKPKTEKLFDTNKQGILAWESTEKELGGTISWLKEEKSLGCNKGIEHRLEGLIEGKPKFESPQH